MAVDDYCAWQGRRAGQQGSGHRAESSGEPPIVHPAPLLRTADDSIDVIEHRASTTIVEQIREGLLKLMRRE